MYRINNQISIAEFIIGLHEFSKTPPFTQRQITNFRKRMPQALIDEINEILFKPHAENKTDPPDAPPPTDEDLDNENPAPITKKPASGTLPSSRTASPANIIHKAINQQLRYVRRNLGHIDKQLREVPIELLTARQHPGLKPSEPYTGNRKPSSEQKLNPSPTGNTETISMVFLCMNIKRRLRELLLFFRIWLKYFILPVVNGCIAVIC